MLIEVDHSSDAEPVAEECKLKYVRCLIGPIQVRQRAYTSAVFLTIHSLPCSTRLTTGGGRASRIPRLAVAENGQYGDI
jgi:hypothetical protein